MISTDIATLRALVPGLSDISVTDDGEFFWLMITPPQGGTGDDPAAR